MMPAPVRAPHPPAASIPVLPLRRQRPAAAPPSAGRRRLLQALFAFVAMVLITDAFVGEKSFIVTSRAREQAQVEAGRLAALKEENARLREERRLLTEDAATIEGEARRQLGLARIGEVMFILKDIHPIDGSPAGIGR